MDIDKMANVIVSGCNGFAFGHWNLSKGARGRCGQRQGQNKPTSREGCSGKDSNQSKNTTDAEK